MIWRMPKSSAPLVLSPSDQAQLERWSSAHGTPQQVALRCNVVLGAVAGEQNRTIADRLQINRHTVELWRGRGAGPRNEAGWGVGAGRGRLLGSRTARLRTGYKSTGTPSSCGGRESRLKELTQFGRLPPAVGASRCMIRPSVTPSSRPRCKRAPHWKSVK